MDVQLMSSEPCSHEQGQSSWNLDDTVELEKLYQSVDKLATRLGRRYGISDADAASAGLDGFVAGLRNYDEKLGPPWPFLKRYVHGAVTRLAERRRRERSAELESPVACNGNVGYHNTFLREACNVLNADDLRLIDELYRQGYTVTELAQRYGVSVSCISHKKSRIHAKVQRYMGHEPFARSRPTPATPTPPKDNAPTSASESHPSRPLAWFTAFILFCLAYAFAFARDSAQAIVRIRPTTDPRSHAPGRGRPSRRRVQRWQIRGPPHYRQRGRCWPQKGKRCLRDP